MILTTPILFFVAIFSTLIIIRSVFRLLSSLLSTPPQKMVMTNWELFTLAMSISYIITYIFKI